MTGHVSRSRHHATQHPACVRPGCWKVRLYSWTACRKVSGPASSRASKISGACASRPIPTGRAARSAAADGLVHPDRPVFQTVHLSTAYAWCERHYEMRRAVERLRERDYLARPRLLRGPPQAQRPRPLTPGVVRPARTDV